MGMYRIKMKYRAGQLLLTGLVIGVMIKVTKSVTFIRKRDAQYVFKIFKSKTGEAGTNY